MRTPSFAAMPSPAADAAAFDAGLDVTEDAAGGVRPRRVEPARRLDPRAWRPLRCGAGELVEEGAAPRAVGEHDDTMPAACDADVEDPALLLVVVGEPVRHDAVGHAEHGDPVPLAALHAVDRRQRDPGRVGLALEHVAEPRFERRRVRMEVGDAEQSLEVVEVARTLSAAGAIEQAHRRTEPDVVADDLEDVAGSALPAGVDDEPQVVGQVEDLAEVLLGHLVGQPGHQADGPPLAPSQRARRTTAAARGSVAAGSRRRRADRTRPGIVAIRR